MVQIKDGDEPQKIPLVYYDAFGERHVVGEAAVQIHNGEIIAVGQVGDSVYSELFADGVGLEGFSLGPFVAPKAPAEEAARRLGVLHSLRTNLAYVTARNPDGSVYPCDRRDLHDPHEWAEDGSIFYVYCPGSTGSER